MMRVIIGVTLLLSLSVILCGCLTLIRVLLAAMLEPDRRGDRYFE